MPGADDTLTAGGPEVDPLDELCTCGHRRGEHHTIDEDCTVEHCACVTFHATNPEFGEGQPSEAQLQAQLDAQRDSIGESVRELTADLPGGEGRIGEIKGELDQILDAALLCDDSNCRHRRDRHKHDGCNDCDCPAFLQPQRETLEVPAFLRQANRSNTREAIDTLREEAGAIPSRPLTHDLRALEMDAEPLGPVAGMDADQREESDRIQAETLDRVCECGHRYGKHSTLDDHCTEANCACVNWTDPRRTEAGAIDHEKLERDRRLPYTPPLLRKKFIGEDELRKVLADAGRLDLLATLPEVDRVTTNYDAEHWHEIERLARNPQGSSETARPESERTITAIATALLELRQCLGVTLDTAQLVAHIERNAEVIHETGVLLDRITSRLPDREDT